MKEQSFIPVCKSLEELYDNSMNQISSFQIPRYKKLIEKFSELFKIMPKVIARAPGRVNIIGEHIDYCGYAVFPAALENDMIIAVAKNVNPFIEIRHMNSETFKPLLLKIEKMIPLRIQKEELWANYLIAAFNHILSKLEEVPKNGCYLLIDSNVPIASGVSSSAAISVSSTLAALFSFDQTSYCREEMTPKIVEYERTTGVSCGGMDQTISVFAEKGCAKLIEFNPMKATSVKLPNNVSLVIANSCTDAPKFNTAGTRYNKRVIECRLGLLILAFRHNQISSIKDLKFKTFIELQNSLKYNYDQMMGLVTKYLKPEPYTEENFKKEFNVSIKELVNDIINHEIVLNSSKEFFLFQRASHVFSEASRVFRFVEICGKPAYENQLKDLGNLMNESHKSCKEKYDCSCEELDTLTNLCIKNGAYGSRLTGAGWGGCCVSLVDTSKVQQFIQSISIYYSKEQNPKIILKDNIHSLLFATKLGSGACILDIQSANLY